ncbi:VCBS repeat-containing protein [Aestuariibaculum lutulentum]|uniref:VCBS repeat-containing protein n=1 Tax=Aestuariibaculum lutulentum TaxID=2920935 RepID=A0ABS9RP62_9FLAO|nr:VCBS repeat-containing protein [Aestuariibaculum lutulentum]MCH4553894.1 VCBS repeat-containing protein [Aestuariibaculum lutulentum]
MKNYKLYTLIWMLLLSVYSCHKEAKEQLVEEEMVVQELFTELSPEQSGIYFENRLVETDSMNYFVYPYIYMGGGVSIGDINNDGLNDIYFTGNQVPNKLYLNKGGMRFEDISEKAGVSADNRWITGTTMADVNNDGFLDIYVSVAGKFGPKQNLLYINNQDLTFTESAEIYGVSGNTNTMQASFFDYDLDGDLDLYVANYPIAKFSTPNFVYKKLIDNPDLDSSDRLYRNDGGTRFTDVTKSSGILNYGLTVGIAISDINNDGYPDVYVSNDFATPDYFYINNGDGTFKESIKDITKHTAWYGMGVDIADINNDGLSDFFQLDMTPENNRRSKANMASMNPKKFWDNVNMGFHYQYMQNCLQLNNGDVNGVIQPFSDISRLAGMATTDWSWGTLMVDFDNDGWKDVVVTNGVRREINNKDYFKTLKTYTPMAFKHNMLELTKKMPSEKVHNYAFKNNGDLTFSDVSQSWNLDFVGFSNGLAYGDLDNDGDLDLVVSNLDSISSIYENQAAKISGNHYLRFKFNGPEKNKFALGTKVFLECDGIKQFQELTLTRGYQSSVEPFLNFGLGKQSKVDKVTIIWPDGKQEIKRDIQSNALVEVNYNDASDEFKVAVKDNNPVNYKFTNVTSLLGVVYKHEENVFDDFKNEPLLPHKTSQFGPGLATADINNDGREDFFVGGANGQSGRIFKQQLDGTFQEIIVLDIQNDAIQEDLGALFFDADNDGDMDLYVVSGGNEFAEDSELLQDRLYINDGTGSFIKSKNALPKMITSGSKVEAADFDNDGDLDLFVGGRIVPGKYPLPARSYLLRNDSKEGVLHFVDATKTVAPDLYKPGLVTDVKWFDMDKDGWKDLIVVGEWMPISIFRNDGGKLISKTKEYGLENSVGWWYSVDVDDFDNDGDWDVVAGNLGRNYKYQASNIETFDVYASDFDKNNNLDIVLGYYSDGIQYPVRGRECSSQQIPGITRKFKNYDAFSKATIEDVYTKDKLEDALHYQAKTFATTYFENLEGSFIPKALPMEAQISAINGIISEDFNGDGKLDLVLAGNLFTSEVETPRNDAGQGVFLIGDGKGNFKAQAPYESGLSLGGDVKGLALLNGKGQKLIISASNDDYVQVILYNP